jgi:molybdenum cofactor guanylyltransferase
MVEVAGIFVGGRGTRMGGIAKGTLTAASGETLVERWRRLFAELGVRCVLVGRHEAYAALQMEQIDDHPPGIGPLGGLVALLERVARGNVLAVACDMPFVSAELLATLAAYPSAAAVVAPRRDGRFEPLLGRYDAARVLPAAERLVRAGRHSLQDLLNELGAESFPLAAHEYDQLRDWDRPEDRAF